MIASKGNQVMLKRGDKNLKHSLNKVKVIKKARRRKQKVTDIKLSKMKIALNGFDDDDDFNLFKHYNSQVEIGEVQREIIDIR